MSLFLSLALRILAIVLICLAFAIGWIVQDASDRLRADAQATAERVAQQIEARPGLGSTQVGTYTPPLPSDWQLDSAVSLVLPGVCVEIFVLVDSRRRLCGGWDGLGAPPPAWFAAAVSRLSDAGEPIRRDIFIRGRGAGSVAATVDRVAATTVAWRQVRMMTGFAVAMAAGICLLTWLAVGHALRPVQRIIAGLRRLEAGEHGSRLEAPSIAEFRRIAEAVNDLASRLERTTAERAALTARLFQVQEDERRALARELHDEFGQCLTAVGALAASIEAGAGERADLASDAAGISRVSRQMMATLRGAFQRLRPPDLDELGLEASLRNMVSGWNTRAAGGPEFRLEVEGDLAAVPPGAALALYRVAQEGLTNAARHGRPSRVVLKVACRGEAVDLMVEDDGGGDPARFEARGFGIAGMRERLGALGGELVLERAPKGLRVAARLPGLRAAA